MERNSDSGTFVLDFINSAIRELSELLPLEFSREMPEKVRLFMRLFHNAVAVGEWNTAYDACLKNPIYERRASNFRQLCNSMVENGSLEELLSMVSNLASSIRDDGSTEVVDLYGIADDALTDACRRDLYQLRANAADASIPAPDYQGALYSLHVSQAQWRRAAQSFDLRFVHAMQSLVNAPGGVNQNMTAPVIKREELIMNDLVLSSVGTANSISLVEDSASRFIVQGEYGKGCCNALMDVDENEEQNDMKRRRQPTSNRPTSVQTRSIDRFSRYMAFDDLEGRALWALSLRTLFCDDSVNRSVAKSLFLGDSGTPFVDNKTLDELFQRGYFLQGLQLSMTQSKTKKVTFYQYLNYAVKNYLVPLSLQNDDDDDDVVMMDQSKVCRPTLSQLRRELDDISGLSAGETPFVVARRSKKYTNVPKTCLQTGAMALLRRLALTHTSAEHHVALDIAASILEYDERVERLPAWLERLLMGDEEIFGLDTSNGLFARRSKKEGSRIYLGDPSALVSLYTKYGLLKEACQVVTAILVGLDGAEARRAKAPHRLPEKGDIDFVPYHKIDILWNLIENALELGELDEMTEKDLLKAQGEMKQALHDHFELVKLTEAGLLSARRLGRTGIAM